MLACVVDCDPAFTTDNDICLDIRSMVTLSVRGANLEGEDAFDVVEARSRYQTSLFNAIFDGDLQDELDDLQEEQGETETRILVITGLDDGTRSLDPVDVDDDNDDSSLSSGAIGGIVVASLFGVALPLCVFLYTRSRSNYEAQAKRDGGYGVQQVEEVREDRPSELEPASVDTSLYTDAAVQSNFTAAKEVGALGAGAYATSDSATLGATQPDYGRASRKAVEAMEAGEDVMAEPELDVQPDSSSNAGSSGWSSSAGLSSYNTGSMDDSTDAAAAAGATLAAIGVSSNLSRKLEAERKK